MAEHGSERPVPEGPLTPAEREELEEFERLALNAFVGMGLALVAIRDRGLCREYRTFGLFLKLHTLGGDYGRYAIRAARLFDCLRAAGCAWLPTSMAVLHPLTDLDSLDQAVEAWMTAVHRAEEDSSVPWILGEIIQEMRCAQEKPPPRRPPATVLEDAAEEYGACRRAIERNGGIAPPGVDLERAEAALHDAALGMAIRHETGDWTLLDRVEAYLRERRGA